jgi:hypothetical protein
MELNQGTQQEGMTHDRATADQGYQTQSGTNHPQAKLYISAMI